jgi:outer membrane receptor protein involved in Fe transport
MKKIVTLVCFIIGSISLFAQNGEISGKVRDENGEGIPYANVVLVDAKNVPTGQGAITDEDGNYTIKPLSPGKYNIQYSYVGYKNQVQQGILVSSDKATFVDIKLNPSATDLGEIEVVAYKVPLIDPGKTSSQNVVTAEEIATMPTRNITDVVATTSGAFQEDANKGISVKGGREESTEYYVDGVKVIGVPTLPQTSIEQIQVITGGVPAKYGDATGGIVNITSKGPASSVTAAIEGRTSQFLDGFGYNLLNGSVTGPIIKNKKKKTILGFSVAFEYLREKDSDPSAVGVWQIRDEKLAELQQNPLLAKTTSKGFNLASENVTYADMYKQKTRPNVVDMSYRGNGKLDIRPTDYINFTVGGTVNYRQYHDWIEKYTLFNSENNPLYNSLNWRVFGRFTHNIVTKANEEDENGKRKKASAFQNAFYSLQFDYERYTVKFQDESHGFNPFDYGYIGKFETMKSPTFTNDTFSIGNQVYNGWIQQGFSDTAVLFTPGSLNPYGTRFTQQYYELLGATPNANGAYQVFGQDNTDFTTTLDQIQSNQALINGQRSNLVYNTWYNTGRQYNGYGYDKDNDQYRVRLEGAFDILKPGAPSRNKHTFEFGVEFEQRVERTYSVNPLALWTRARLLANAHLTGLDKSNPIFRINGQDYAYGDPNMPSFFFTDTILFNRLYDPTNQSFFDKSIRAALGKSVDNTDFIDVDALDPSTFSLEMFSPTELLGDGTSLVTYRGYDSYGNKLKKQPSFSDFFTKKRDDGEYERAIGAYRPIYTAAYISDRFYFKDLTFNVGVRIDRFDANQSVLRDKYSLYPIYTASEVTTLGGVNVAHPSNVDGNSYVYVDNIANPTSIIGYRNGDKWYDKFGNELATGQQVASTSSTGTVQPYLKNANSNIKDEEQFDPNASFKDYTPQIIVMPRLQFSFNLTDKALFFAHYDVLSQRPQGRSFIDPTEYFYFQDNIGSAINNPDLKPERTIDFQLGFKNKVSNTSAITIAAYYREFRNQIQIRKIINAYPKDYITYDNIDFSTVKGFNLEYDLRRTGNISLKANYTLQFADGTGSDDRSQLNLVNSNSPNFRSIFPLNFDARHMMNVNVVYSFADGKDYNGPVVKNSQILSNSGISFSLAARSGTPYTRQDRATPEGFEGQPGRAITEGDINSARIPWYFRLNARIWKDFQFEVGKKKEGKDRKSLGLNVYFEFQNILGLKNITKVYRYTGTPDDDGFVNSAEALATIQAALNPQAFKDQYNAYTNRSDNYGQPRRIYFGATLTFF